MCIAPKQIELPTGLPIGNVNAYIFIHPEPILVDAGLKSEASLRALELGLAKEGISISDLSKVIISHPHVDHLGLVGVLMSRSNADVYIFDAAVPWLVDYFTQHKRQLDYYTDYLFVKLGLPSDIITSIQDYYVNVECATDNVPPERVIPFYSGDELAMGGDLWQVLHTPGHASLHTCFYQPDSRRFLSADMLLSQVSTPTVEPPPDGQLAHVPSLPQLLKSLAVINDLDIDLVFPGHGNPFADHKAVIKRQRVRIHRRKTQCFNLIVAGQNMVTPLLQIMYPHYPPQFRFAALWMIIGYLDLLKIEGKIIEREINGVWHYFAADG